MTADPRLVLDEMLSPAVADALQVQGHEVLAAAATASLRSMADPDLFRWAAGHGRRIVTENVRDFRPLLRTAETVGAPVAALLLTSSRSFPRSRRNPGPLIAALDGWLRSPEAGQRPTEDWLFRQQ